MAGLKQLNWASEGVGATAAALVDLSTVAGNKISNPPWVKFQSAGWVNFPSAPTVYEFSGFKYTPFVEAGIGVAFFSKTDVGEQQLGSSFNFEDRIGAGLKLPHEQKVGIRAIHYSNAGIKQPNDGIESYSLFYNKAF